MKLYSAIDLHSNNHVLTVIDEHDRRVYERSWRLGERNFLFTLRETSDFTQKCTAAKFWVDVQSCVREFALNNAAESGEGARSPRS